jgi:c-di-GMP-binding flagellar brake protein YcgR
MVTMGCWLMANDGVECLDVADISEGGMAAATGSWLPAGQRVTLQFFTPRSATALTVTADVVWNQSEEHSRRAGFRFVEVGGETLNRLRELALFRRRR